MVDFWADWCAPCKFLGPIVEKLAIEAKGKWKLVKVNTEKHGKISSEWGIRGIPNIKLFYKGEVIDEVSGAMPENDMRNWLKRSLPTKTKELCLKAKQLINDGDTDQSIPILRKVIAQDSENTEARLMLARLLLWENPKEVEILLNNYGFLEPATELLLLARSLEFKEEDLPDGLSKKEILAGLKALKLKEFDPSINAFIKAIATHKSYWDEMARRLVIAVFHYLGEGHEVTKRYRRRFDMVLY